MGVLSGTYLFIESSSPRLPGNRAWLLSQPFGASQTRCLSFWYHMNGAQIGTLNVLVAAGGTNFTAWTLAGDQGNTWKFARAPVRANVGYKVCDVIKPY